MMKDPQRITLCGMGGQGIILSAVILGTAAVTRGKKYAVRPSPTVLRRAADNARPS